jgi:hypothetical protein
MFYATWISPAPLAGTLRFRRDPRRRGLGIYEDVDGVKWDVNMINGEYIAARRVSERPDYYSTAGSGSNAQGVGTDRFINSLHRWKPYAVEIVE